MKKATKKQPVTLNAIKGLLKEEFKINNEVLLLAFDRDIKSLESRVGSLEDKIDGVSGKVDSVNTKVDAHIRQNEIDFAGLHTAIQDIIGGLDKSTDEKIARHVSQKHTFVTA